MPAVPRLLRLVAVLALIGSAVARAEIPRVPWLLDPPWPDVLARAAADGGRPILIHFHATWCGPCRLLDAMVYNEGDVVEELADVVTAKYDIDVPANAEVRERFGIELLPTLVWCDPRGREVDRFTGYRSAAEFLDEIAAFRAAERSSRTLAERLSAAPEDPDLLLEMAALQARRGHARRAEVLYRRASRHREDPAARTRALLGLALLAHKAGDEPAARAQGRAAARTGAVWTEVVAFQEAIGDSLGLLETYRARSAADDMDVVALDGFARVAVGLDVEMEEASRHALRAVVLSDEEPETVATLAESYHRRGLHEKALRWIAKALEGDPPGADAFRAARDRYEAALAADPYGRQAFRRARRRD